MERVRDVGERDLARDLARDAERDLARDEERDRNRYRERDRNRDRERDRNRDKERDRARDDKRDRARDEERDRTREKERVSDKDQVTDQDSGLVVGPILTVEKVMEVFQRISSINTPQINSKLALPFMKDPVKSSNKFKQEYEGVKSDLRKISGGLGKVAYQKEKERRKSLPFEWPLASPPVEGIELYSLLGGRGASLQ